MLINIGFAMKYSVNMTICKEIANCNQLMRPFLRSDVAGRTLFPVLSIDVAIKHAEVEYLIDPLDKRTKIDHQAGKVMIALPANISGYHAHAILMSGRGLQMISRIAYDADFKVQGVCAQSPESYAGYLYDLWACLQDFIRAEIEIEASELLLKELRLTVTSLSGRKISRFESMAGRNNLGLSLSCSDTGLLIDSELGLQQAISYRIKKAAVNSVAINGLEDRIREIHDFCYQARHSIGSERLVDRPMPNTISYASFSEAIRDVALSFELAESGAVVFGDVTNKNLMSHASLMEEFGVSSSQGGYEARTICKEDAYCDSKIHREKELDDLNKADNIETNSIQLKLCSSYSLNTSDCYNSVVAGIDSIAESQCEIADSPPLISPLGISSPQVCRVTPRMKPKGVKRPPRARGGRNHFSRPNRVCVLKECGIKSVRCKEESVRIVEAPAKSTHRWSTSHAGRNSISIKTNPSSIRAQRLGPDMHPRIGKGVQPPLPTGIIQIVHNAYYLQFEYSKWSRVARSRAPP